VGYIYAFRYGDGHEFKIGVTANLDRRLKQLQTGSPRKLTLFTSVEHAEYREGEKFLKRWLAANKLEGGEENFDLLDDELIAAMAAVRVYVDEEVPLKRRVEGLGKLESGHEMLPATDPVREAYDRLLEIRDERDLLRPEEERLAAERARLDARYEALAEEEERLRLIVMDSIGAARGIDGVATWETVDGRRRFDEEWLKSDEPELFEAYRTKFDATRFRKEHPKEHAAHMRVTRVRVFLWFDEPCESDVFTLEGVDDDLSTGGE
jgi:hypothetical protein